MIPLGLKSEHRRILHETMTGTHTMRIRVQSTTLDGDYVSDLTPLLMDGQVNVDQTADVTRSASLTLLDPDNTFSFDSDSPSEAALFLDRMIRIWYCIRVNYGSGAEWEDIPIFTGPISSLSRSDNTIDIECQGKEVLAMGVCWEPLTIPKNKTKVAAIRIILRERAGEDRFHFQALRQQLPKQVSLGRSSVPWTAALHIAQSLNDRQLFYDGRGTCRLRNIPARSVFTIHQAAMLSPLQVSYTQDQTVNAVFIRGGVPEGKKHQITAEVWAAATEPLSPARLGRNGVPRYLMEEVQNARIRNFTEAKTLGRQRLRRGMGQAMDASFDCMPIPTLEPGDLITAVTDQGSVTFRLHSFSIPLSPGTAMTMNYLANVRRRPRIRATKHWHPTAQLRAERKKEREANNDTTVKRAPRKAAAKRVVRSGSTAHSHTGRRR